MPFGKFWRLSCDPGQHGRCTLGRYEQAGLVADDLGEAALRLHKANDCFSSRLQSAFGAQPGFQLVIPVKTGTRRTPGDDLAARLGVGTESALLGQASTGIMIDE